MCISWFLSTMKVGRVPDAFSSAQFSSRVEERRSLVAFYHLLVFGEALIFGITKTSSPRLVLTLQRKVHEQRTTQKENKLVSQHHTLASPEPRLLALDKDAGRHDTVQVAPADHHAENNSAFQGTFRVVCEPRQSVWHLEARTSSQQVISYTILGSGSVSYRRVDSSCTKESASVLDFDVRAG